jgi:hypothetical protein
MNRKFEDKLVRLAFGETNPRESSALERKVQSDPEAARKLEEYQSLKIGLNLLTDVPPDQLSKERLRNAILGQGLKPLPVENPTRWGWAWMPATAFALAFAWIGVRHMAAPGSTPGPRIVMSPSSLAMNEKPVNTLPAPTAHTSMMASPVVSSKPRKDAGEHLVAKRHTPEKPEQPFLVVNPLTTKAKSAQLVANKTPTPAPQHSVADQSDPDAKLASINRPLVVINPESDNNSGAQKATEVDGASDVGPVGG